MILGMTYVYEGEALMQMKGRRAVLKLIVST